ncbi:MAG: hypothetical protein IKP47_02705 [Ruminococcus sp.]|nr:hypothetical protein [Ruminococcus sp.]
MKDHDKDLLDQDDEEYERNFAELSRRREQALREAEERAEEERIAREREERREHERQLAADRIELMKLKTGVIDESETIKEEHEEKRPMTFKEKLANFWYHYKIPVIFGAFILGVVGFIVHDEITRVRPDFTVMMIANNGLTYREHELKEFFEQYIDDYNGDGEVCVSVMNIPIDLNSYDTIQTSNQNKLIAQIQEGTNIMMIIDSNTDPLYANRLLYDLGDNFPGNKYFAPAGFKLNFKFLAEQLKFENMPNDVILGLRAPVETLGDSKETMQKNYDQAYEIFTKIVNDLSAKADELKDPGLTTEPIKKQEESKESTESK